MHQVRIFCEKRSSQAVACAVGHCKCLFRTPDPNHWQDWPEDLFTRQDRRRRDMTEQSWGVEVALIFRILSQRASANNQGGMTFQTFADVTRDRLQLFAAYHRTHGGLRVKTVAHAYPGDVCREAITE